MKKTILITLFLFLFAPVAFANESIDALIAELEGKDPQVVAEEKAAERTAEEKKKEFEELKKRLRYVRDPISGYLHVYSKKTPYRAERSQDIAFYIYVDDHGYEGRTPGVGLFYIFGYYNNPIIFMDQVAMNIDGEVVDMDIPTPAERPLPHREYVWMITIPAYKDIFYKVSQSKKTLVRFSGRRGAKVFEVTKAQKEALYDIWSYYEYRRIELGKK